jgi:hypothetical protein
MKKETIIIVSVLGVGILGFLGYKWYKNKSSLNSKFIENKNLVKKPIKKASPTSKQVDMVGLKHFL